ncbi:hypothetical protein QN357_10740 [Cryobacterium sp. RTC2.1]|uniref:AfsR/SARP family transcriptional regulator n=1 Tax=unclassified Cryobacterium TaxID=2649013 RepID=UPI002B23D37F|nr:MULTISPECIES: hypothetical protein [unclassified Cryobacterium]MEB0003405.1 hypothetical protein [Cryobacterium sp. RTC2.1]MEB0201089.1 hypothetical protein [Cryobacterium sp. 5I3]
MRIRLLGGLSVEHDGRQVPVTGSMQLAVLFRLAVDAGTAVSYRAISEDVWSRDVPENQRAALQSIVSRLRAQLPPGVIESTVGGYRLLLARSDVDALRFEDLVAEAVAAAGTALPADARRAALAALALWAGEPWIPSPDFDWFLRDLARDRARALELTALDGTAPDGCAPSAAFAPSAARGIPVSLTRLVGRERELAAIEKQLAVSRLVTIVGTGGIGKTRLALETAAGIRGAVLVELAPVGPGEVLAAVLAATGRELRTSDAPVEPVGSLERVVEALLGRAVVLVLDNCEHVIDAAARLAENLLGVLPALTILATSREPLGIPGESFVTVGSLPHPSESELEAAIDTPDTPGSPERLREFAALELFGQRALAARGAGLATGELAGAARICARLDGLPLALELAAAKLRTMTLDEVLDGLDNRFTLLTGGYRTALPRHQTLRALIDWSWSLLSADERTALGRLAVFPAGIDTRDAADVAATAGLVGASVFESLVDKSLLHRERGRYRLLETIREYGIERLAEAGNLAAERAAQAGYIAVRAEAADALMRGPRIREAIAWFDAEDDNVTAALRYTTSARLAEPAVRVALACVWYWGIRERRDELGVWLGAVSELAAEVDSDEARAIVLFTPVVRAFSAEEANPDAARDSALVPEALAEAARRAFDAWAQDPPGRGGELMQLAFPLLSAFRTSFGEEGWMLRVRIPSGEELGLDPWPAAMLHVIRAATAQNRGDIAELGEASAHAVRAFEAIGDLWGLALAQQMRAEWFSLQGRLDEALDVTDASTANMSRITSSWDLAQQQALAVSIMLRQGRLAAARERADELLAGAAESGNIFTVIQAEATALVLDLNDRDTGAASARLARIEDLASGWPNMPAQLVAMIGVRRAELELLQGDADAAERAIRVAADAAIASLDHPVIGQVALSLGGLALARGQVEEAVRALDLSSAIIGAYDRLEPRAIAIEQAAAAHGIDRATPAPSSRPHALATLRALIDPAG